MASCEYIFSVYSMSQLEIFSDESNGIVPWNHSCIPKLQIKQISKRTSQVHNPEQAIVSMCQMESRKCILVAHQEFLQNVLRVIQLHSTSLNRSEYIFALNSRFGPNVSKQIFSSKLFFEGNSNMVTFQETLTPSTRQPFVDHGEYIYSYISSLGQCS